MKILKFQLILFASLLFFSAKSQEKQEDKIIASAKVLNDFGEMKESIPKQLLEITEGIIIVPKLINGAFVVGGKRGKGVAMVKLKENTWSNPVFVTITGGSVGLQIGLQAVDLVLIFKDKATLENIGRGSFTLGGDISATAGPLGRNSTASTDYKLEAEVYSYSRSKGLFAGISITGAAIAVDAKSNEAFYGEETDAKTLFSDDDNNAESVKELKKSLNDLYRQ
ncbi:MAG: lipid-binding SYLF domain-containing protein [Chitinophagaceae bacterium]|nr:lipid-binding SYLF domain-containing protein [Chitinophagaceae bacterium]